MEELETLKEQMQAVRIPIAEAVRDGTLNLNHVTDPSIRKCVLVT
jgi:hypothetical protein